VDAATREPVLDIVSRVISSGGTAPVPAHLVLLACDGREIVVAERFAPIRDRDSRIVGIAIVFRDVTEQLRAQQQLQRTEKLEALGILAGGIAHDFNNILTGIFGHIELALQRSSDQALVERNLSRAHQVIGKARGLAAQLLTFTRAGEPVTKSVALDGLLRDSARFVLSGSSVSAQLELPPDLWPCQVDPRQIEQVVDNLLLNARQAMPEGGVVQISAENVRVEAGSGLPLAPGAYVRLLVRDHGIGVPKNLLSRVFDPFFTTKATGTGLGLATSYSIVKKHGGHIELDSEVGIGSTFTLYLPVAGEAPNVVERTVPIKTPASGRVLVMDDDDVVREIAAEMLTGLGYEVDVVRNGVEAISHYEAAHTAGRPFTVVILDLTIPGGTGGVGTLARLRRIAPQVKAIASSGYASDPVMARPEQSGFAGTLTKPYTFEELAEVLHRVLGSPAV
jgi:signal transduction histidine kinase/CheY-like chemotaxis protein